MRNLILFLSPGGAPENRILLALLIYAIGCPLFHLNTTIGNCVKLIGILYFLCVLISTPKRNNGWFQRNIVFILLVLWILITTFRMFIAGEKDSFVKSGLSETIRTLFLGMEFIPCLMPLSLLLFRKDKIDVIYFLKISHLLLVLFLCFSPFALYHMFHYEWSGLLYTAAGEEWGDEGTYGDFIVNSSWSLAALATPVVTIFLKSYLKYRTWFLYLIIVFIQFFMSIYMARRSGVILWLFYLFICFFFYLVYSRMSKFYYVILGVVVCYGLFELYQVMDNYSFFELLVQRGINDTRSGVEASFYKDMDETGWVFGRSWFGTYYEPAWMKNRTSIETGFLSLILRGGIVYLILYLCVLLPSAIKGLCQSKNVFVKAFSLMIFFHIIELYPFGWPSFTIGYFSVWIGAYICQSQYYRNLTDEKVKQLYFITD